MSHARPANLTETNPIHSENIDAAPFLQEFIRIKKEFKKLHLMLRNNLALKAAFDAYKNKETRKEPIPAFFNQWLTPYNENVTALVKTYSELQSALNKDNNNISHQNLSKNLSEVVENSEMHDAYFPGAQENYDHLKSEKLKEGRDKKEQLKLEKGCIKESYNGRHDRDQGFYRFFAPWCAVGVGFLLVAPYAAYHMADKLIQTLRKVVINDQIKQIETKLQNEKVKIKTQMKTLKRSDTSQSVAQRFFKCIKYQRMLNIDIEESKDQLRAIAGLGKKN